MLRLDDVQSFADVDIDVGATLPCDALTVRHLLTLAPGSIIRATRPAGDHVDLRVGDQPVGSGEIIVIGQRLACRLVKIQEKS